MLTDTNSALYLLIEIIGRNFILNNKNSELYALNVKILKKINNILLN